MVNIKHLTKENVGQWVEYVPVVGKPEQGKIKSWNDTFVFVVFHCDDNWGEYENYTGCAVSPEDLRFLYVSKEAIKNSLRP